MRRLVLIASCLISAAALAGDGAVSVEPDPPSVPAPKAGQVSATLLPAKQVKSVTLVSRATGKTCQPSAFDRQTGKVTFAGLPGDAAYDVQLVTTDGRAIEGIDLEFVDARLQRLADARRKQLDLPARKPGRFTQADVDAILEFVAGWEDFMDTRRVLYVQGHGDRATLLVELMRLKEFHASGTGESQQIVWRVELWYMQRAGEGWQRVPNVERLLRRFRGLPEDFRKIHVEYTPELTAHVDADGQSSPLRFEIPARPDPAAGRPAGSEPRLDTSPRVLGVDDGPAASQPAESPQSAL